MADVVLYSITGLLFFFLLYEGREAIKVVKSKVAGAPL